MTHSTPATATAILARRIRTAPPRARQPNRYWALGSSCGVKISGLHSFSLCQIQNPSGGIVCANFSYFALHKRNVAHDEFSYFRCCAAAALRHDHPLTARFAGAAAGCEMRRHLRRFVLEFVNAPIRDRDHPGSCVLESARDPEAAEVRKLTALLMLACGIIGGPVFRVAVELYDGYCARGGD